jgi:hypothetical protein
MNTISSWGVHAKGKPEKQWLATFGTGNRRSRSRRQNTEAQTPRTGGGSRHMRCSPSVFSSSSGFGPGFDIETRPDCVDCNLHTQPAINIITIAPAILRFMLYSGELCLLLLGRGSLFAADPLSDGRYFQNFSNPFNIGNACPPDDHRIPRNRDPNPPRRTRC